MQKYFLVLLFFLLGCSAQANPNLWPPQAEAIDVTVYSDGFHSVIVMPDETGKKWGYAYSEEQWDLHNSTGCFAGFRAMVLPSQAVLEVRGAGALPKYYSDVWRFKVSPKGLRAMRHKLKNYVSLRKVVATRAANEIKYYHSNQAYHVFHTCNKFTANILKAGGLPISSFWVVSNSEVSERMDELYEKHVQEGLIKTIKIQ